MWTSVQPLYQVAADLVRHVRNGDASVLAELFHRRVEHWPHHMMYVEGGSIGLFSDVTRGLASDVAFALIPSAVGVALAQRDAELLECALLFLIDLARASDTTELPGELDRLWPALERHAAGQDGWQDLTSWYRR
jgi:hypothetical protein